jgi:hypothetical protein
MIFPSRRMKARRDLRTVQRRCASRLAELQLPPIADMRQLCAHLAARRDRPIHLVAMALHAGRPCGIWLRLPEMDVIAYESDTNPMHQDHIVAHELAHLVCDHTSLNGAGLNGAGLLFPDLDPSMVSALLHRSNYCDQQELEAETMASLLLSSTGRLRINPAGNTALTSRLEQALLSPDQREG